MKTLPVLAAMTLCFMATAAFAQESPQDCEKPTVPTNIPADGSSASQQEMSASQSDMKAFADEANSYLGCLQRVATAWGEEAGDDAQEELVTLYNSMVAELEQAADRFNAAVRAYQAEAESQSDS